MKVFMVFLAILIINISFLVYQGDLGRYLRTQTTAKAMAEECGAGAALFYQPAAYGDGYLVSNTEEAIRHIEYVIDHMKAADNYLQDQKIDYTAIFFDDTMTSREYYNGKLIAVAHFGYPYVFTDSNGKQVTVDSPAVIITIAIPADKIFRMPFLKPGQLIRSSMYELASGKH